MIGLWLKGLLVRRPVRLIGAVTGVALTVALFVSIAAFIASGSASMTRRAGRSSSPRTPLPALCSLHSVRPRR